MFGSTDIIGHKASPQRTGNLRQRGPLPTHHFVANEIKAKNPSPMILFPYEAIMSNEGITYDAYTMDRWTDPERTDYMMQQSAWVSGRPWDKILSMGSNMRQIVSGPDGNPGGVFTGKSGVRVGIRGSSEPVMTDFGDLYANFNYNGNGGTMEVPLVRGSALLTHIFNNANPVVTPFCLSTFNGQHTNFDCPKENTMLDAGSGHASATCNDGQLHLVLDNTKKIPDVTKIQWAASSTSKWRSGDHGMRTCNANTCRLTNNGKRVEVTVPNAHGTMAFAFNYIGHYLTPPDWINKPEEVTCHGRRSEDKSERGVDEMTMHAICDGNQNLKIVVHLGNNNIHDIKKFQYGVQPQSVWGHGYLPPMYGCTPDKCSIQGHLAYINVHAPARSVRLVVNIIGYTTLPFINPFNHPYDITCGGSDVTEAIHGHTPPPLDNGQQPHQHTTQHVQHTHAHTQPPHVHTQPPPVHTQPPPVHTQPHVQTNPPSGPSNPGSKFIMELNEPGSNLPGQTRKFVLYFQHDVIPHVNQADNSISFTSKNGGSYNGFMQLGYLGAGPRGDHSNDTFLDNYLGVYSYKPKASYCVNNGRALVSFDWHPNNQFPYRSPGKLLMVTMPHHSYNMMGRFGSHLKNTVYGFKGYEGGSWLLDMEAPRAALEPDPSGVQMIKSNSQHLQEILQAIDRDAAQANLEQYCRYSDSYNTGKGIGFTARLASISRAFGTNHYHALDGKIKNCLELWLRVDDSIPEKWKFHYDSVWGGLYLRATDGDPQFYTDYGFPFYNDHHFHLGYFLYALAYYVRHDKSWAQRNKHRIYALARDVGNPSNKDRFFPVALNCYHALAALGDAYGDPILRATGQVMLAMETASVREYWHVRDHNYNQFPPVLQEYGAVGMIAESSFYAYTLNWGCDPNVFPMRHGCLVGIQVIPITAASKYWMDKDWAKHILKTCDYAINPNHAQEYGKTNPGDMKQLTTGWKAFCHAAMAPYDTAHQTAAANYVKNTNSRQLVGGTGVASTLLFIYAHT
ncbi:hypothetical protein FSP39_022319 [Pinctada imbricata]|uniref:glucan endo-1,3-beta-D-glucosidase n=1 Tax=Pinctada imbricata TaxID=66713 RepID=A0AA88XGN5_PINIB|nr:hypothetical protein FSP39_022319 [Pinctada imbricata]